MVSVAHKVYDDVDLSIASSVIVSQIVSCHMMIDKCNLCSAKSRHYNWPWSCVSICSEQVRSRLSEIAHNRLGLSERHFMLEARNYPKALGFELASVMGLTTCLR